MWENLQEETVGFTETRLQPPPKEANRSNTTTPGLVSHKKISAMLKKLPINEALLI